MYADLFVQIPNYTTCGVYSREFRPLLIQKGWHEIEPGVWVTPVPDDPDIAFIRLTMSITPRGGNRIDSSDIAPREELPIFQRRLDLGEDVWAFGGVNA